MIWAIKLSKWISSGWFGHIFRTEDRTITDRRSEHPWVKLWRSNQFKLHYLWYYVWYIFHLNRLTSTSFRYKIFEWILNICISNGFWIFKTTIISKLKHLLFNDRSSNNWVCIWLIYLPIFDISNQKPKMFENMYWKVLMVPKTLVVPKKRTH